MVFDLDDLDDDELLAKEEELLRLQKQELDAGQMEGARQFALERDKIFKESRRRGLDL